MKNHYSNRAKRNLAKTKLENKPNQCKPYQECIAAFAALTPRKITPTHPHKN